MKPRELILELQKTNKESANNSITEDKVEFGDFSRMSKEEVYHLAFETGVISACHRLAPVVSNSDDKVLTDMLKKDTIKTE